MNISVLLQYGIERKTSDVDGIYQRAYSNFCPYHKVFSQTFFLKARGYYEYLLQGLIMGNNINIDYGAPKTEDKKKIGFAGAIVGDPELNDHVGTIIFGRPSKYVFEYVVDFDFSAMYPNIIITFNMAPNTLIGKLFVEENPNDLIQKINSLKVSDLQDINDEDDEDEDIGVVIDDMGKDFIDNLLTGDIGSTGAKWFNLPKIDDILERVKKELL